MALAAVAVAATPTAFAGPLAAPSKPRVLEVNWVERTTRDFGYEPMTFKVAKVTITAKAWAVHASVTNRSTRKIRIARPLETYPPQYTFGLGWAPKCEPPATACPLDTRKRTYARPAIPAALRPGQTWAGVFGGPGSVARGKLIYVTFGRFVPAGATSGFNWVTQSAFKL